MNLTDTSDEALAVQLDRVRKMSPHERLERMCAWSGQIRLMTDEAIKRRHPEMTRMELQLKFLELVYGKEISDDVSRYLQE